MEQRHLLALELRALHDTPIATMPPDSLVHTMLADAAGAAGVTLPRQRFQ